MRQRVVVDPLVVRRPERIGGVEQGGGHGVRQPLRQAAREDLHDAVHGRHVRDRLPVSRPRRRALERGVGDQGRKAHVRRIRSWHQRRRREANHAGGEAHGPPESHPPLRRACHVAGQLAQAILERRQILQQVGRRRVAIRRVLREAPLDDPPEQNRRFRRHLADRARLFRDDRRHRFGRRSAAERMRARREFIEDEAERELVGAVVDLDAARLLRTHVLRRAGKNT